MKTSKIAILLFALALSLPAMWFSPLLTEAAGGGEIFSGETRSGEITLNGQSDSYTFEGKAGQGIVIEMAADGSSLEPNIALYAPKGNLETKLAGGVGSTRVRLEDYQLKQAGIYTLLASASENGKTFGKYGLSLVLIGGNSSSRQDPDGGTIISGQTLSAAINPSGDTDIFTFEGKAGQGIEIEMATDAGSLGLVMYIFAPNGTLENKTVGGDGVKLVRLEDYHLKQSGIYTVVASAGGSKVATGKYGLSLALIGGSSSSGQDPDGGPISPGQTLSASINTDGDTDIFTFQGKAGQVISIEMAAANSSLEPFVNLYAPGGSLETRLVGGSGVKLVRLEDYQLKQSGTFTAVASASGSGTMTGQYRFSLAFIVNAPSATPALTPSLTPAVVSPNPSPLTGRNILMDSVPLPSQVSTDTKVIATNVVLALLMLIIFYMSSTLFNSTFRENYETIQGWGRHISGWFGLFKPKADKAVKPKPESWRFLEVIFIIIITAIINSIIDPHFGIDLNGLIVFIAMVAASVSSTYGYDGIQALVTRHSFRIPAGVKAYPLAILLAIIFVTISRAVHFYPGLIFGFVGAYSIISTGNSPDTRQRSISILLGVIVIMLVTLIAFFLRQPLAAGEGFWHAVVDTSLVAIFVICIEGLIFGLMPLTFLDGGTLSSWKKWVWAIAFVIVSFLFYHIIVNKTGALTDAISEINVITMFSFEAFCVIFSVLFWLYFRLRTALEHK